MGTRSSYQQRKRDIAYWKQRNSELENVVVEMLKEKKRAGLPATVPMTGAGLCGGSFVTDIDEWCLMASLRQQGQEAEEVQL